MQRRHFGVFFKLRSGCRPEFCWFGMRLGADLTVYEGLAPVVLGLLHQNS
jgi:hypothetical protein